MNNKQSNYQPVPMQALVNRWRFQCKAVGPSLTSLLLTVAPYHDDGDNDDHDDHDHNDQGDADSNHDDYDGS